MLMMGLSRNMLWASYFIHYWLIFLISCTILTTIFCGDFTQNGAMISYSNPFIIWIFFMLYGTSLICLGFFISTLFKSSSATAATTTVAVFVLYMPFDFIK